MPAAPKIRPGPAAPRLRMDRVSTKAVISAFRAGYLSRKRKQEEKKTFLEGQFFLPPGMPGTMPYGQINIEAEKIEVVKPEGMEIPIKFRPIGIPIRTEEEKEYLRDVNISYYLIPRAPKRGEIVYAYANIKWDEKAGELLYTVKEPAITQADLELIEKVKADLEERLDIDFTKLGEVGAKELLRGEIEKSFSAIPDLQMDENKKNIMMYFIERDVIGLGRVEPFMQDPNIEDISCDGVGIPLYVYHRDPKLGSMKTNMIFESKEEINEFAMKLAQKCNKTISIAEPLLDGSLPDGSRVQATLGTDIARRGSNFTIRKFTEKPLTPTHMLMHKTLDTTQLAYLWLAIENGQSILISGGTATGKTSLLNALSLFIRPNLKIVSIEDTPELRLPHTHWIPEVARTPISVEGRIGEVSLFDLLKSSLRQRPDYIVLGEVRGKEAFVLFQQMASVPGSEQVLVCNGSHLKSVPITELEGKTYNLPTMDAETGNITVAPMKMLVEHTPVSELFKITTSTGREVVATGNHSIFTYNGKIEPAVVNEMKNGDSILIPAKLPAGLDNKEFLDLTEMLHGIRVYSPKHVKAAMEKLGFDGASKIVGRTTISNYYGVNNCALPAEKFRALMNGAGIGYKPEDIEVRFERGKSPKASAKLDITPELLRLIGYYISEGSLNTAHKNNSISLYNSCPEVLDDMKQCISVVTGSKIRERDTEGFGKCKELTFNHKTLFELLKSSCGIGSENKRIPDFVMGLSEEKLGWLLSGLYAGDAHMGSRYFGYYTVSKQLVQGVCNILLSLSIMPHIRVRKRSGRNTTDYEIIFYRAEEMERFLRFAKPAGKHPNIRKPSSRKPKMIGDLYIDSVKKIEKMALPKPAPVYDISVPGTQNFVGGFGGVMLHNTGHPSLATIHAASFPQLVDRLITPPISLPPSLLENINIVVFLVLSKMKGGYVRRADTIVEVIGVKETMPVTKNIFVWKPINDSFEIVEKSIILSGIARRLGLTEEGLTEELGRRKRILEWMLEHRIFDYREVARVISTYYTNPERIMSLVEAG